MRLPMRRGFSVIPEGEHVFRIYGVECNDEFGVLYVHMVTAEGLTHRERFQVKNPDDSPNDNALFAFSAFASAVMGEYDADDIDPEELVGHYVKCDVVHTQVESKRPGNEGKMLTFANLGRDKTHAEGFEKKATQYALTVTLPPKEKPDKEKQEVPKAEDLASQLADL